MANIKLLAQVIRDAGRGPAVGVGTMLGRGHVMRHLLDALSFGRPPAADPAAALPALLESFLARHDGMATWRLTVDKTGAQLHVEL